MSDLGPRPSFIGCWDYRLIWERSPADRPSEILEVTHPEGIESSELLQQMPYEGYLRSKYWHGVRAAALEAGNYECAWCSATEHLDVHHMRYRRRGFERLADLIVLCRKCHSDEHGIPP